MGERVYVGSCSGKFFAFERRTGVVAWSHDASGAGPPANYHGNPVVAGDRLVVGTDVAGFDEDAPEDSPDGHLWALELASGRVLWKRAAPGGFPGDLARWRDAVYAVSTAGELLCLGLADGERRWSVRADFATRQASLVFGALELGGRIVFSAPEGTLTAVDPLDGRVLWRHKLHEQINTALVGDGSTLWVGTDYSTMYRIDAADGRVLKQLYLEDVPYGTPVVAGDSLLVLQGEYLLARIDPSTGAPLWTRTAADEWSSFRPLPVGDRVLVGNGRGELVELALADGMPRRVFRVEGMVRGFSLADDVLYIGTLAGTLFAYDMRFHPDGTETR